MFDNKDYSTLTLEELQVEAKRIKNHQLFSAGLVGFLIGIMIYGAVKNGFGFLYIVIPLLLIGGIAKNSQSLKVKSKEIEELIGEKT